MRKRMVTMLCLCALFLGLAACGAAPSAPKIGVSFGVGAATRWPMEQAYMEARAKELGVSLEARLNTGDGAKTQEEDCFELIDSGIQVLILIPRNANDVTTILDYAKEKKVKVISYARVVLGEKVDLFVGYDSEKIGQSMGQYLAEVVYTGDYIILQGDSGDNNAKLLYEGAMRSLAPIKDSINILLDEAVPGWDPATAKEMVKAAVAANGNHVDAILAPNDTLAGACVEALSELGVTEPVAITGMDAQLDAVQRIAAGSQNITIHMDLRNLARTAVDEACHMAKGEKVNVNAEFDNQSGGSGIPSNLINGQVITRENLDKILIDSGYFSREEVYSS